MAGLNKVTICILCQLPLVPFLFPLPSSNAACFIPMPKLKFACIVVRSDLGVTSTKDAIWKPLIVVLEIRSHLAILCVCHSYAISYRYSLGAR